MCIIRNDCKMAVLWRPYCDEQFSPLMCSRDSTTLATTYILTLAIVRTPFYDTVLCMVYTVVNLRRKLEQQEQGQRLHTQHRETRHRPSCVERTCRPAVRWERRGVKQMRIVQGATAHIAGGAPCPSRVAYWYQ